MIEEPASSVPSEAEGTAAVCSENQTLPNEMIYGSFVLGDIELAINARELQEVVNLPDDLSAVPLAPDYFIGVFSLRESIVPVINMRALLKKSQSKSVEADRRDCIAIIRVGNSRMGLLFDCTSEVLRINRDQVELFSYGEDEPETSRPVQGIISLGQGERLVQVLDPLSLLKLPGVPLSQKQTKVAGITARVHKSRRRCITFGAGGNRYGFRIDAVSEIIPMPEIQPSGLQSETCIGRIELRGTILPVLDFGRLLNGPSSSCEGEGSRIIIARVNQQSIGFRVNNVEGIIEYASDELQPLPEFEDMSKVFLAGCIVEDNATDICLIDHEKLYATPEVTVPAETGNFNESSAAALTSNSGTETCLLVSLGFEFLLPVEAISEIIDCPDSVSPISGAPDYVEGIFNLRKKVVTVVDMRALYDLHGKLADLEPKLLVAELGNGLVGLRVDGVRDIVKVRSEQRHLAPGKLLSGWSEACQADISEVFMQESAVLPLLPLKSALQRISRNGIADIPDVAA